MKKTYSRSFGCLLLTALGLGHTPAQAQVDLNSNGVTNAPQLQTNAPQVQANYFQYQTNTFEYGPGAFQPAPIGPTVLGTSQLGAPSMGTSALPGPFIPPMAYTPAGRGLVASGPFDLYPSLSYSAMYGDGVLSQPGQNLTTWINTVTPSVLATMGAHWLLDYTPSFAFYSNPLYHNTTDQTAILNGATIYGNWAYHFSQSYTSVDDPLIQTASQVAQEAYATKLNASWQMSDKLTLQLGMDQTFLYVQAQNGVPLDNLKTWSTSDAISYLVAPQLSVALQGSGGYSQSSLSSDMPFEMAELAVYYQPSTRLQLSAAGGFELSQFVNPSAPSLLEPVFSASLTYKILEGTTLSITASRTVIPSFYANEVNVDTVVSATLIKHIYRTLNLEISGAYATEPYSNIEPGPLPKYFFGAPPITSQTVTRDDATEFAQARLSMVFRNRLTSSLFYTLTRNASSQANFSGTANLTGVELDYHY